nr:MAG TPA: hypothetical protein [Caudoviricetes sp.]
MIFALHLTLHLTLHLADFQFRCKVLFVIIYIFYCS